MDLKKKTFVESITPKKTTKKIEEYVNVSNLVLVNV